MATSIYVSLREQDQQLVIDGPLVLLSQFVRAMQQADQEPESEERESPHSAQPPVTENAQESQHAD